MKIRNKRTVSVMKVVYVVSCLWQAVQISAKNVFYKFIEKLVQINVLSLPRIKFGIGKQFWIIVGFQQTYN